MAARNHSSRYSKRYKRTHFWNKMVRKPVGPYGGLTAVNPDGCYVKLRNYFDFGVRTQEEFFDRRYTMNAFQLFDWQPTTDPGTIPLIVDKMSNTVRQVTNNTADALYPTYGERQAWPLGWAQQFNPYSRYQVQGVKVTWKINPRMSAQWYVDSAAGTQAEPLGDIDIVKVGMAMHRDLGNNDWFTASQAIAGTDEPDSDIWGTYDQKVFAYLPLAVTGRGITLSKYFSMAKYFQQPPEVYKASAFNPTTTYTGSVTYDTEASIGFPTAVTEPSSLAVLHLMFSREGNAVTGAPPSDSELAFTGTITTTYYVWMHNPDSKNAWYFGRTDGT